MWRRGRGRSCVRVRASCPAQRRRRRASRWCEPARRGARRLRGRAGHPPSPCGRARRGWWARRTAPSPRCPARCRHSWASRCRATARDRAGRGARRMRSTTCGIPDRRRSPMSAAKASLCSSVPARWLLITPPASLEFTHESCMNGWASISARAAATCGCCSPASSGQTGVRDHRGSPSNSQLTFASIASICTHRSEVHVCRGFA